MKVGEVIQLEVEEVTQGMAEAALEAVTAVMVVEDGVVTVDMAAEDGVTEVVAGVMAAEVGVVAGEEAAIVIGTILVVECLAVHQ